MKFWIKNHKLNLLGSLLAGLVVGYIVSFYYLSVPAFAQHNQGIGVISPASLKPIPLEDDAYWKGRIDERLQHLVEGQEKVNKRLEALDCSITEIKVRVATQGGIYGGIASIIVLVASVLGKGLFKSIWRKDVPE